MRILTKKFLKMAFVCVAISQALCAQDIASGHQTIYANDKEIGEIYKGALVNHKESSLVITGYAMNDNDYILFYSKENRIKIARLKNEFTKLYKVIAEEKDMYGVAWKKVELTFTLKDLAKLAPENTNIWAQEEELYQRCGSCHKARTAEEYTVNQWPNVIKTMSERAGFTLDETKAVGSYMQYQALTLHVKNK